MKRLLLILLSLCAAAALAACAGPGSAAAENSGPEGQSAAPAKETAEPAPGIEPEELISKQEAEELLGEEVKDGEKSEMVTMDRKTVLYKSAGSFMFIQLDLTQRSTPEGGTVSPDELYGAAKTSLDDTSDMDITGIGDDCFTGTPGLHILADGCYIVISVGNTAGPEEERAILKAAGELAAANLRSITGR